MKRFKKIIVNLRKINLQRILMELEYKQSNEIDKNS